MKPSTSNSRIAFAICTVALAAGLAAPCAKADEWNKKTILTVNDTIQVQDTVLQPGKYVMRLLDSSSDRHVVQIFNDRENHVYATILATPKQRMEPTGDTQFTFWETPAGTARAMRAWFYPGDTIGQEFNRPKHPYQIAMAVAPAPVPAPVVAVEPAPETSTAPAVDTTPAPVAEQPTLQPTPDTDMAEAAPPDQTPPTPTDQAPAPQPAAPPQLPQTGSPYPMLGLSGAILLALGGLLRLRRLA
jgi:LPXTG-motif cell wall-anchored protein